MFAEAVVCVYIYESLHAANSGQKKPHGKKDVAEEVVTRGGSTRRPKELMVLQTCYGPFNAGGLIFFSPPGLLSPQTRALKGP